MLTHPTLDTLRALKLDGMAEAFTELQTQDGSADLTHAEWLGLPIDREAISRETKRFESRMRTARLRHIGAAPEDVDYKTRRGLDKALFQSLLSGKWIKDKRNLMIHCLGDAQHRWKDWPLGQSRQNLAGLRVGPSGVPRRRDRPL